MGTIVSFAGGGGGADGYLAEPAPGTSNGRGVIVIQEWWGMVDHIKDVADRFAREGFTALAPDLYHGKATTSPDEAGMLLMALDIGVAGKDLRGAISHLRARVKETAVGTVGFCMGGALSLYAACDNGPGVGACVIYYGGHPKVTYDWDRLTAPVLGHWAEKDDFANPNAAVIERELAARGKSCEFHHYPGTEHAFFNDTRPHVYDDAAARLSWERTLAFFRSHL